MAHHDGGISGSGSGKQKKKQLMARIKSVMVSANEMTIVAASEKKRKETGEKRKP